MIAYVDSSVVLRVVLGQRNRLKEFRAIEQAIASTLVEVECLRTLDRLRLRQGLSDRELSTRRAAVFRILAEFRIVEPSLAIFSRASQPFSTPLGTLDAIHLATALVWKETGVPDLLMATHDASLALAASASGLRVLGAS